MTSLTDMLRRFWAALTRPPAAPCCTAAIRWASFR